MLHTISSVQLLSCVQLFATSWTAARQASLSITNSQSLLMPTELMMPSNHLILCRPLLLPLSIIPSIRVFFKESVLRIRWPKYRSFSFSISPFNEHPGMISFRLIGSPCCPRDSQESSPKSDEIGHVQGGTAIDKSLLQHHSSKASILQHSTFVIVQLSHPYMTTGKTIALTGWTFVGKVMSLFFNILSSLVIAFLSRIKHFLI